MEYLNTRHSWEWETDFEQSLWVDIGEEEGVESLVDNENNETAREPKSKIKLYFSLFCVWFYVRKEMVHGLAYSVELWMYLGSWESTQKSRVALGYHLERLLRFFRALDTSRVLSVLPACSRYIPRALDGPRQTMNHFLNDN